MARAQEDLTVGTDDWIELTDGASTSSFTWQVKSGAVELHFTTDGTKPGVSEVGQFWFAPEGALKADPANYAHVAATRVWGRAVGGPAVVYVDG